MKWLTMLLGALVFTSGCATSTEPAPSKKVCDGYVALTYDDGPTEITEKLANELSDRGMTATFFLLGESVIKFPEVAKKIAQNHQIGNHSYGHPHLSELQPKVLTTELNDTNTVIEQATGFKPDLFRPPFGDTNNKITSEVERLGMTEVIWTLDTFDWKDKDAKTINASLANIKNGDVVLMHDDKSSDIEAIDLIENTLTNKKLCTGKIIPSNIPVKVWDKLTYNAKVIAP